MAEHKVWTGREVQHGVTGLGRVPGAEADLLDALTLKAAEYFTFCEHWGPFRLSSPQVIPSRQFGGASVFSPSQDST